MEIEKIIENGVVDINEINRTIELSKKIEAYGPMHLTMILVD